MPRIHALLLPFAALALHAQDDATTARTSWSDLTAQDTRQYDITLRVDVAAGRLVGNVRYTITAVEELATIQLDALRSPDWHVSFTTADGHDLPAQWHDDHVVLTLPERAAKGSDVHFTASIEGAPVDGFYFKDNRYGERLAFTDHYSIRARGWLPCEDNPADRARFSLLLTYPAADEALGYGVPGPAPAGAAEPPEGWRRVYLQSATEIPPYMFAVVVGPLARVHEGGDARLVDHYVYRRDVDAAKKVLVHDAEWLHTMETTFGPYAFGKYTTVQCPTRWGGFEAPGNVQLAEDLFDAPAQGTGTLAHELVHMWFGDGVGYAEWREVWLSEGFASYLGPWLHAMAGGPSLSDSLVRMRAGWRQSFEGRTKTIRDDHFAHPDQALNSNTYPKGAWVLHMLRGELGDEVFFGALKAYYEACRGRSVRTSDFVAAVEKHSKRDLGWFFAQWLDRVGCPELRVGSDAGVLLVEQVQKGEPYTFWLRLRTGSAAHPMEQRVRIDSATQRVPIEGPLENLELDPQVELLYRLAR
ncbi:MAG TPA: M1 family aminopeptidase [Planctomycetota bacterium]|nr:M1 family aminopeptidase [Planctomycetota bacterium]